MRLKHKVCMAATILAIGAVMASCSSASSTSTAASSAASSTASSESASFVSEAASSEADDGAIQPQAVAALTDPVADGTYSAAFAKADVEEGEGTDGIEHVAIYAYDTYDKDDIEGLEVGDVIKTHLDGSKELESVDITSVEINDNGAVINGGIEEGGMELKLDGDVYRTVTMDDYPVYYELGTTYLAMDEDIVLNDSSADYQAEAVVTTGDTNVLVAITADDCDDYWFSGNTTVTVKDGKITEINRVWVP